MPDWFDWYLFAVVTIALGTVAVLVVDLARKLIGLETYTDQVADGNVGLGLFFVGAILVEAAMLALHFWRPHG